LSLEKSDVFRFDPERDLVLEREIDVPPALVWAAWTKPEELMQWFCPRPWKTVECEIDLRPGGIFRTVMQSPEGVNMPGGSGCYLEVVENRRLVWTSALAPGYRPVPPEEASKDGCGVGAFTAAILMEAKGKGTKYRAMAIHATPEESKAHEAMGFHDGWGAALDQLVELCKAKAGPSRR
jgi:uncharacterized protein YndB with AHSA1/START domain